MSSKAGRTSTTEQVTLTQFPVVKLDLRTTTVKAQYLLGLTKFLIPQDLESDRNIHDETLFVGRRTFYNEDDGLELYYYHQGVRHSLAVVEFQSNGGYKLIFHAYNKFLLQKKQIINFPKLYQGLFLSPLFPECSVFSKGGITCILRGDHWLPMRLDTQNARHYVLINSPDIVDNPTLPPVVGSAPARGDHWHSNVVQPQEVAVPSNMRISSLASVTARANTPNREAHFDPDKEVIDIPVAELL